MSPALVAAIVVVVLGTGLYRGGLIPMAVAGFLIFVAVTRTQLVARTPLGRLRWLVPVTASALQPAARWAPTAVTTYPSGLAAVLALGRREIRHLLLSPLFVAGLIFTIWGAWQIRDDDWSSVYNAAANSGPAALLWAPLSFFVGNTLASRGRRDGAEEIYGALPMSRRQRVLALALAAVAAGLVALAVQAGVNVFYFTVRDTAVPATPGIWEVLVTPLGMVGGVALGVMVGVWAPWRGVPVLVFFLLVAAVGVLGGDVNQPLLTPYVEFANWEGKGLIAGSRAWHFAYVGFLDAMAIVGALVWLPGRRRGLLALGAAVTLGAIVAGTLQLP